MNSLLNIAKPALVNSLKLQATRIIGSHTINASSHLLRTSNINASTNLIRSYHENVIF